MNTSLLSNSNMGAAIGGRQLVFLHLCVCLVPSFLFCFPQVNIHGAGFLFRKSPRCLLIDFWAKRSATLGSLKLLLQVPTLQLPICRGDRVSCLLTLISTAVWQSELSPCYVITECVSVINCYIENHSPKSGA